MTYTGSISRLVGGACTCAQVVESVTGSLDDCLRLLLYSCGTSRPLDVDVKRKMRGKFGGS